ncbi:MAG: hypothetical protein ACRD88_06480, partial [Terriglobia bacterium]
MSRKQLSYDALYAWAMLCAATLTSCSLEQRPLDTASSERATAGAAVSKTTAPGAFELAGAVKADEFNDRATGQEVPAEGGQIILRFNAEPDTLNTWLSTADAYTQYIAGAGIGYIHESLLRLNKETFEWEPSLAERWIEEDIVVRKDGSKARGKVSPNSGDSGPVAVE